MSAPVLTLVAQPVLELNALMEKIFEDMTRVPRPQRMIYYGANTCWWTHRASDLHVLVTHATGRAVYAPSMRHEAYRIAKMSGTHPLPCDPRGGVLMEAHDVPQFFSNAATKSAHYGKHGTRALCAAHHDHGRAILPVTPWLLHRLGLRAEEAAQGVPWCEDGWPAYNAAIDAWEAR